jgi:hypothetical protein
MPVQLHPNPGGTITSRLLWYAGEGLQLFTVHWLDVGEQAIKEGLARHPSYQSQQI